MIRVVTKANGRPTVYGFTIRGVGVLGASLGILLAALVLSVLAFRASGESTRNRVRTACLESNRRHVEAIPQVAALLKGTPPKTDAEAAAQVEVIVALRRLGGGEKLPKGSPRLPLARAELVQVLAFVQVLAPHYDCQKRVERLTKA